MIHVYNINTESHKGMNNYYCGRGSILGNPYTHLPLEKTMALYKCRTREESIQRYSSYFDLMYGHNIPYTNLIDEIYEKYKNGEEVYLGCFCRPLSCHCDVIVEKLQKRLFKEKFNELKKKKDE